MHVPTIYCRIIAPDGLDQSAWDYSTSQAIYGLCDLPTPPRDPSKYGHAFSEIITSFIPQPYQETSLYVRHSRRQTSFTFLNFKLPVLLSNDKCHLGKEDRFRPLDRQSVSLLDEIRQTILTEYDSI